MDCYIYSYSPGEITVSVKQLPQQEDNIIQQLKLVFVMNKNSVVINY